MSGTSTTYVYSADLDRPASGVTRASRFVLYDNGAFSFRYDTLPGGPYAGSYRQEEGRIVFDFGADNVGSQGGQPEATATIVGTLLAVRFSDMMLHSDFENAMYQRIE